ncbi:GGDEF domain-containing protein [Photobacterium rosenbergii]|uniref:diguanylate cyclase n=2 Tax=Photobacterium rosenbergii TaxID=294936 RepID=A0A2T3NMU2_9GAMM|nr:GGDEF domain-containing protein [Photobacterium rosenbergii]
MTMVFKSHQLQSDNHAYIELSKETLKRQLSILFPVAGIIFLIISFSYFVATNSLWLTSQALLGALLCHFLATLNKRIESPRLLIWVFIIYTTTNCIYGFYTDGHNLLNNTIALTIPLLCFFTLRHQYACWYSLLFGMYYVVMSADEYIQKHLQINEALQNISAYAMVLVMAYLLAQHRNEAINKVKVTAKKDFLTGLLNRKGLEEQYLFQAYRCNRYLKDLSLILVDIDGLKDINDRYGLDTGDQILIMVSQFLKQQLRPADSLARMGNGEFCLLLPDTSQTEAETIALKLIQEIKQWQLELENGKQISVTVSIGLTLVEYQNFSLDYIKADSALLRAKNWGKDQIAIS